MANKLAVIINSLKVPKIKKILLYEMKFPVPNYNCLQKPWLGGYRPQVPVLSVLNWICWTPPCRTKFLGTPLFSIVTFPKFTTLLMPFNYSTMLKYVRKFRATSKTASFLSTKFHISNLTVTLHPFLADFLHWRTRRTHRSTTHCRSCGHTAHALRPRSRQFLMALRVECIKMEEQLLLLLLLLLLENPLLKVLLLLEDERLIGWTQFLTKEREVWRVSYFVPNAAGASTKFFQYFIMVPDTFWYIVHNIRPYI